MAFRFEGLEIFHAAIDFSARVYETVKQFPAKNASISHRKHAVLLIRSF